MTTHGLILARTLTALSPLCLAWRNEVGAGYTLRGTPITYGLAPGSADIIVCAPGGRFVGVEIKAGRDRQRPDQVAWQRAVEGMGGVYLLAREPSEAVEAVCNLR